MVKLDHYYYKPSSEEESVPKIFFSLDWFAYEDRWTQRYLFSHPRFNEKEMKEIEERNLNRHKGFTVRLNLMNYHVHLDFKLAKVGNVYYGRVLRDVPKQSPFRRQK